MLFSHLFKLCYGDHLSFSVNQNSVTFYTSSY